MIIIVSVVHVMIQYCYGMTSTCSLISEQKNTTSSQDKPLCPLIDEIKDDNIQKKSKLNLLDKRVRQEYARFMTDLEKLLRRKEVSVNDAIFAISYLDETTVTSTSEMQEATTIQSFLLAFRNAQSWYNFDTTSYLAELLAGAEGRQLVESYEEKLKVNLRERMDLSVSESDIKTQTIIFKVNMKKEKFNEDPDKAIEFTTTVMRLLELEKQIILRSVRSGCVELTYLFPLAVTAKVRNIIKTCNDSLIELHVISVTIGR